MLFLIKRIFSLLKAHMPDSFSHRKARTVPSLKKQLILFLAEKFSSLASPQKKLQSLSWPSSRRILMTLKATDSTQSFSICQNSSIIPTTRYKVVLLRSFFCSMNTFSSVPYLLRPKLTLANILKLACGIWTLTPLVNRSMALSRWQQQWLWRRSRPPWKRTPRFKSCCNRLTPALYSSSMTLQLGALTEQLYWLNPQQLLLGHLCLDFSSYMPHRSLSLFFCSLLKTKAKTDLHLTRAVISSAPSTLMRLWPKRLPANGTLYSSHCTSHLCSRKLCDLSNRNMTSLNPPWRPFPPNRRAAGDCSRM